MKEEQAPPVPSRDETKKPDNITAVDMKNEDGKFLRRAFRNEAGDWVKTEKLVGEINKWAAVWDGLAEDLIKAQQKIEQLTLQAYQSAPAVESLYYDSPCSPAHQIAYAKQHLKRLGWAGIRDIHLSYEHLRPFSVRMKEACSWLLKFRKNEKS